MQSLGLGGSAVNGHEKDCGRHRLELLGWHGDKLDLICFFPFPANEGQCQEPGWDPTGRVEGKLSLSPTVVAF